MITCLEHYSEWAHHVEGKKLQGVKGLLYAYEFPDIDHPQQLQFVFADSKNVGVFKCAKDGSTLEIANLPMQENDLGEYGKELIIDISEHPMLSECISETLQEVYSVFSKEERTYVGLMLKFSNECEIFILNIGDELNMFKSLPLAYEQKEGIIFKKI